MTIDPADYRRKSDVAELLLRLGAVCEHHHAPKPLEFYAAVVESMDDDGLLPPQILVDGGSAPLWAALRGAELVREYDACPGADRQVVHHYLFTEPTLPPPHRVYFIESGPGGPVKIGRSRRPGGRVADLQTGCPHLLRILASVNGGSGMEDILHKHFDAHHIHGEWFRRCEELDDLIAEVSRA